MSKKRKSEEVKENKELVIPAWDLNVLTQLAQLHEEMKEKGPWMKIDMNEVREDREELAARYAPIVQLLCQAGLIAVTMEHRDPFLRQHRRVELEAKDCFVCGEIVLVGEPIRAMPPTNEPNHRSLYLGVHPAI